jgi:hypothetical protein
LETTVGFIERLSLDSCPLHASPGKGDATPMPLMIGRVGQSHVAQKKQSAISSEGFGDDPPLIA